MSVFDAFSLKGRSALVTGAASGLGLAYAQVLAEAGARVTLTDIDAAMLAQAGQALAQDGATVRWDVLDVTDREQTRQVFAAHAAGEMKKHGRGGSIVATSSNAAIMCEPIVGLPYMPAKAGVAHMVRHLALELAEFRIRVNAIAPGPFVTNIGGGWLKKDPQARKAWDANVPLGRVAEPEQIKPLALFLASDASDYMTGAHLVIDGGMSLGKFS